MTKLEEFLKYVEEKNADDSFITPCEVSTLVEIIRRQRAVISFLNKKMELPICKDIIKECEELARKAME